MRRGRPGCAQRIRRPDFLRPHQILWPDSRKDRGGYLARLHGLDRKPELPTRPSDGVHPYADHPLFGKSVTFTGALAVRRRAAQQAVVDCGGTVTRPPTRETDILVTGYQDLTVLAAGATKSAKLAKAERLRVAGQVLEVVSERDFVRLLSSHRRL